MDALEEGYIVSVAFIDARAGFDTLLNSFLLRKLQMIGYPESTMDCKAPFSNPEGHNLDPGHGQPNFPVHYSTILYHSKECKMANSI